jgi:hypothetical protein
MPGMAIQRRFAALPSRPELEVRANGTKSVETDWEKGFWATRGETPDELANSIMNFGLTVENPLKRVKASI